MMKFSLVLVGAVLALSGCASSTEYQQYLEAHKKIEEEKASAVKVQAIALQKIATESTDPTVQAVSAMMLGLQAQNAGSRTVIAAPQNGALEWVRATSPLLGAVVGGVTNYQITKNNNATQVELYSKQMDTFGSVTMRGFGAAENLGTAGINAAKDLGSERIQLMGPVE